MTIKTGLIAGALAVAAFGSAAHAQLITAQPVISGLTRPVYVTHAPGDASRIYVVEQRGSGGVANAAAVKIYGLPNYNLIGTMFTVSPVSTSNEQGLLGMAFHPNYASNGKIYVHYSNQSSAGATTIAEYVANGTPLTATTASLGPNGVIFTVAQPFTNHNGGWMQFGPDGLLYLALGDGGSANDPGARAQNTFNLLGKILRFDVDGDDFPGDANKDYRIPAGNPFANGVSGVPEVYSFGVRNPWRNDIDPVNGALYIADVGQNAWEEVNVLPLTAANGKNFGWRCLEADVLTGLCTPPSGTQPILLKYGHASSVAPTFLTGCSLTGGVVYRGSAIPELDGTYFFAEYCSNWIFGVNADPATNTYTNPFNYSTKLVRPNVGNIVSFGRDAANEVYIVSQGTFVHKIVRDANNNNIGDGLELPFSFNLTSPANAATNESVTPTLVWTASSNALTYNVTVATDAGLTNVVASTTGLTGTSWVVSPALAAGQTYFWRSTAVNNTGSTLAGPSVFSFTTTPPAPCTGDINGDGFRNTADLTALLGAFGTCPGDGSYNAAADIAPADPCINTADLTTLLGVFGVPCP